MKPAVSTLIQYLLDGDTFNRTYSMFCTWSAVACNWQMIVIKIKFIKLLTTWKINFGKERKIIKQKKKNNYQLCKKRMCTATYVLKHSWRYFLRSKSLKPAVGTWIQYLLDEYTFNHTYSMFCTWSSVAYNLYFIVIKYKFTNFGQQNKFFLKKKKKNKQTKNNYQIYKKRTCTATYVMDHV